MKTTIYILYAWKVEKTTAIVEWDKASNAEGYLSYSTFTRWVDFFETEEEAKEMWEKWKENKIEKMRKSILKLEKKKFTFSII